MRRMTSVLQLMPGETLSCVGCHESRQSVAAASNTVPLATQRAPTPLTLPEWGNAGVLDYNRVVQPVLDRHCVKCHQGTDPPKGVLLTGDFTRFFNMSYDHLVTALVPKRLPALTTPDAPQRNRWCRASICCTASSSPSHPSAAVPSSAACRSFCRRRTARPIFRLRIAAGFMSGSTR